MDLIQFNRLQPIKMLFAFIYNSKSNILAIK